MKNQFIALVLLLTISTVSLAGNPVSVRTRIVDDSQTLTIQIDQQKNGHNAHYLHSFDVSGMNFLQKDWLKYRVFAEQDVTLPLHEMQGLLVTGGGLLIFLAALLVVGIRHRRASLQAH